MLPTQCELTLEGMKDRHISLVYKYSAAEPALIYILIYDSYVYLCVYLYHGTLQTATFDCNYADEQASITTCWDARATAQTAGALVVNSKGTAGSVLWLCWLGNVHAVPLSLRLSAVRVSP